MAAADVGGTSLSNLSAEFEDYLAARERAAVSERQRRRLRNTRSGRALFPMTSSSLTAAMVPPAHGPYAANVSGSDVDDDDDGSSDVDVGDDDNNSNASAAPRRRRHRRSTGWSASSRRRARPSPLC